MHRHDRIPVFVGHVEQHAVSGDPRVVDDDAQAPETVGRFHQLVGGGPLADITRDGDSLGPRGRDLVDDVGLVECACDVVDHDRRACSRKPDGLSAAQTRGRAGYHRDKTREVSRS